MNRKHRSNTRRSAIGLMGSVAFMVLATGSIAAQDAGHDPIAEIEAPQLTGVTPADSRSEPAPTVTGYDAMIADLQQAAAMDVESPVTAYESMIADLQTAVIARVEVPATAYESMIADLQRAAAERDVVPATAYENMVADLQSMYLREIASDW